MTIAIAVINHSTRVTDADVQPVVQALQIQINRDFATTWGFGAKLFGPLPQGQPVPPQFWQLVLFDHSDQAGALGYHDLTASGQPLGKVFVGDDLDFGSSWSVTMSHELLEMLGDPTANRCVAATDANGSPVIYALEVADACEDDSLAYEIDGVKVSDFVKPAWFDSWRAPGSVKFDVQGHVTAPFQLLKGGYIGMFKDGSWSQIDAEGKPVPAKPGRRTDRRARGAHTFKRSAR
jgi:hypothetical protein